MPPESWVLSEAYAGLRAQGLGLAEAAGLLPGLVTLRPRAPWSWVPAALWPAPLVAVSPAAIPDGLLITAGGTAAAVGAAMRRRGAVVVQVQDPRMRLSRFDLVVANRHDRISGPNVILTRTALHRATPGRLAAARRAWAERFADLPRPLVAVLVGGGNGRLRLGAAEGRLLADGLAEMVRRDRVGLAITPSRRTAVEVVEILRRGLKPPSAWIWDGVGENPYFGMLASADLIVVTMDSISMVSEAVATSAPVLVVDLPGRSGKISRFIGELLDQKRVRKFAGRPEMWPVTPLDDTAAAGEEMRARLGL